MLLWMPSKAPLAPIAVSSGMNGSDYIISDPQILVGKPTLKGTRISVDLVLRLFGTGWTKEQVLENYPNLTPEMLQAAFAFAAEVIKNKTVKPQAA